MTQSTIAFLVPYFGKWPEWIELYFDSIERNSTIDFHFFTDCDTTLTNAPNLFFHPISFQEYIETAQRTIGIPINIPNPYKICDLRPFFGVIHQELIKDYDFFGWTDVDVLFGDIRSFYTPEILANYDVLSSQAVRLSGHCALMRNTEKFRKMGYRVYDWQGALSNPEFVGIDEHGMTNALCMTFWDKLSEKLQMKWIAQLFKAVRKRKMKPYYFVEQYSTPFIPTPWLDGTVNSDQPNEWYYSKGVVTNNRDRRNFMYVHFMNFKSSHWRHDGTIAPWEKIQKIVKENTTKDSSVIIINEDGISSK